jgi:hypothetical protein
MDSLEEPSEMTPNPYQPPNPYAGAPAGASPGAGVAVVNRTPLVLAAIGAWLASLYWAATALLRALDAAMGGVSGVSAVLPVLLVVFYAMRGLQVFRGDPAAARRLLWLHVVGAVAALVQTLSASGLWAGLSGVKVLINLFGAVTAFLAQRAIAQSMASRG